MLSSTGSSLARSAHARAVPGLQAPDFADGAMPVAHWGPALGPIRPRRVRFQLARLCSKAGRASQRVFRLRAPRLQMQLHLAIHADPAQVTFRDAPLLADAAAPARERSSPADQGDVVDRANSGLLSWPFHVALFWHPSFGVSTAFLRTAFQVTAGHPPSAAISVGV